MGTKRVKCIDGLRFPKGDDVKILAHQCGFCVMEVSLLRGSEVKIQIYGWLYSSMCTKGNMGMIPSRWGRSEPEKRNEPKSQKWIERVMTKGWFPEMETFIMVSVLFLNAVWLRMRCLTSLGASFSPERVLTIWFIWYFIILTSYYFIISTTHIFI